jgi:D-alanyl-D-alanine carboxypeptidase
MTAYITFKAMKEGKLRPKQKLPVSSHAASRMRTNLSMMTHYKTKMVTLPDGRKKRQLYYRQTVTDITTEDALRGLIIQSANDAAVVLAEKIGGSEKKFVAMMNATAQELGMTNTTFANPHGLPDNRQISTVEDMAKLSAALIRDFPEYYHYFSETRFTYRGHTYHNHNRLLGAYEGMDGLKTGYISSSGNHLSASAKRGENRVIAVVFGAAGRAQIVNDIPQLLDFGFRKLRDPAATFILDGPQTPPPPPVDKPPAGDDDETDFGKPEQVLRTSSRTPRPV